MNKNILILILLAVIIGLIFIWKGDSQKVKKIHKNRIDSIQKINFKLLFDIGDLKDEVSVAEMLQEEAEILADSLQKEASQPISCEHELIIRKKENNALRGALNKCKEAKVLQAVTIKKYDSIIVNHEVIVVNYKDMEKIDKKEKKKSFLKGLGVGGAVVLLICILL